MGQIQNEINSTISTLMGAAVGAKHLAQQANQVKEQKAQVEETAALKEQQDLSNKLSAIEKAESIQEQTDKELDKFNEINQSEIALENEATGLRSSLADRKVRTSKGQFFGNKAMQEMEDRQNEIRLQRMRQDQRIKLLDEKREIIKQIGVEL